MSDFSRSLGELRETNQVVEDTVEYCESLLSQFSQQEGVDTNVMDEAKECVRNAIEHVVEHIHATGEQLDLALKVEESKTEIAFNKVQELNERVSKLDSWNYLQRPSAPIIYEYREAECVFESVDL